MPKKGTTSGLGRSLIKAHKKKGNYIPYDGFRLTSEIPADGGDLNRLNLNSVTEQTSLDDFLDSAALAESAFNTEVMNIKIVEPDQSNGILSEKEKELISSAQEKGKDIICIPRRPHWDLNLMSKEEIDSNEKESFLIWRRKLAVLQETDHINLTPFEKNLEVWRQLWRVIERSDVVVQIIDARNPILFQCLDLESYVKEVDDEKLNILLLNKADLLTQYQRKCWSEYYQKRGVRVVFFSALEQGQRSPEEQEMSFKNMDMSEEKKTYNSPDVLSREELLCWFWNLCKDRKNDKHCPTVGLVGYPNVGKSSTLNALLMQKKTCVSATPGKTKHFQTFQIDPDLCLCDCPGLVFPNFVFTKADMVINGILSIDQLTECNQPITLVAEMIPRKILQANYSILIPLPGEGRDPKSPPTAEELLNAHGYNRGYMTERGLPDNSRSARYILKDFVNGKLLYCHAPPGVNQEEYHQFPDIQKKNVSKKYTNEIDYEPKQVLSAADKKFFSKTSQMHVKGRAAKESPAAEGTAKPWKEHNKHHNKNKKEKLRRVYRNFEYDV